MPRSLHIAGTRMIEGIECPVLESPDFEGMAEINASYVDYGGHLSHTFSGVRWCIDPKTFVLLRAEGIAPLDFYSDRSLFGNAVWEFPEGYYRTAEGFAPRKMICSRPDRNFGTRLEITFQIVEGGQWFLKGTETYADGRLTHRSDITELSFNPIDPRVFDLKAAGYDVSESTGTGSISGTVIDHDTRLPISDARVRLVCDPQTTRISDFAETSSGIDGSFQFTGLPDNYYTVAASKDGYVSVGGGFGVVDDPSRPNREKETCETVHLEESASKTGLTLALASPRTVRGRVIRADNGEAVPDAEVTRTAASGGRADANREIWSAGLAPDWTWKKRTVQTDKDGWFQFDNLSACEHGFVAGAEGFCEPYGVELALRTYRGSLPCVKVVDLSSAKSKDDIVLELFPGGLIEGHVLDPNSKPVSDAVICWDERKVKSQSDGAYKFTRLPTTGHPAGKKGLTLVAYASGFVETKVGPVLLPDSNPVIKDIVLGVGGSIAGRVNDASGTPIVGARVFCPVIGYISIDGRIFLDLTGQKPDKNLVKTDEEGGFRSATPLKAGKYTVVAAMDGYQPEASEEIEVVDGQCTEVNICLKEVGAIAGIVVDSTDSPLESIQVSIEEVAKSKERLEEIRNYPITRSIGIIPGVRTGSDGRFSFAMLQDSAYDLKATRSKLGSKLDQQVTVENVEPGQTDLVIRFGELQEKPKLAGTVVDAQTLQPIREFTIALSGELDNSWSEGWPEAQAFLHGKTIKDASGVFLIENLPTRKYEFVVFAPGYAARAVGPFDLKPAEIKTTYVPLRKEGRMVGRVYAEGPPRNYNSLYLKFFPQSTADLRPQNQVHLPDRYTGVKFELNPDGAFSFSHIPQGSYNLMLHADWGTASVTCVSVTEGVTTQLGAVRLEPTPYRPHNPIPFILKKPDGSPWADTKYKVLWPPFNDSMRGRSTDAEGRAKAEHYSPGDSVFLEIGDSPRALYPLSSDVPENVIVHPDIQSGGVLKGIVMSRGMPVIGKKIKFFPKADTDPFLLWESTTNLLGRFSITNVPSGDYYVFLRAEDAENPDTPFRILDVSIGDAEEKFMRISLEGATLSGRVVDRWGQPANGAFVQIGLPFALNHKTQCAVKYGPRRSTQANEYGVFSFSDVQPGRYEIWSSRYSIGVSKKQSVEVGEENITNARLVLE